MPKHVRHWCDPKNRVSQLHEPLKFKYDGKRAPLNIPDERSKLDLAAAQLETPTLFPDIEKCNPIVTKSRSYSRDDREFIGKEVDRLVKEVVIEANTSPWRSQVLIVRSDNSAEDSKRRLCIDYSCTVNHLYWRVSFTENFRHHYETRQLGVTNGVAVFQRAID